MQLVTKPSPLPSNGNIARFIDHNLSVISTCEQHRKPKTQRKLVN